MFHTQVALSSGKPAQVVCQLIGPILRSKYPSISVEEQKISIPLQILGLAILDAILVHILNSVCPSMWEDVRSDLSNALIHNKASKICSILNQSYRDMDVIFIQEAAAVFPSQVAEVRGLNDKFAVLEPFNLDAKRNQNSMILVDRNRPVLSTLPSRC
jgi:hypothetical protein